MGSSRDLSELTFQWGAGAPVQLLVQLRNVRLLIVVGSCLSQFTSFLTIKAGYQYQLFFTNPIVDSCLIKVLSIRSTTILNKLIVIINPIVERFKRYH